eukprot:1169009-Amorphochlora_amoeboformis.AAC.1
MRNEDHRCPVRRRVRVGLRPTQVVHNHHRWTPCERIHGITREEGCLRPPPHPHALADRN